MAAAFFLVAPLASGSVEAANPHQPGDRGAASAGRSRDSHDRQVRIHNQTGWIMTGLYAQTRSEGTRSRARTPQGADRLALAALRTGDSAALNIDDGTGACVYDLQAEFANGQVLVRSDINVCRIADYYFTR